MKTSVKQLDWKRKLMLRAMLVVAVVTTLACFAPFTQEVANFFVEKGRREMGYVGKPYDFETLKWIIERILYTDQSVGTEWGGELSKTDPRRPSDLMEMEHVIQRYSLMAQKRGLEDRTSEIDFLNYRHTDRWQAELNVFLTEYRARCVAKFGQGAIDQARGEYEKTWSGQTEYQNGYLIPSHAGMIIWFMLGVALTGIPWLCYSACKAMALGYKLRYQFLSGRIFVAAYGWFLGTVRIFPFGEPKDQIFAALRVATYFLGGILSCGMMGGITKAQSSQSGGKKKQEYAFVGDVRVTGTPGEGYGAFGRLIVTGDQGFVFEGIVNTRQTPTIRAISVEVIPGENLLKTDWLRLNAVAGGKFTATTDIKTNQTARSYRALAGLQVFMQKARLVLMSPINRIEIPIATSDERLTIAHAHQGLLKLDDHWRIGEDTNVSKMRGKPWQRTLGVVVQYRPSKQWPTIEGGVFRNLATERYSFRGRMLFAW